VSKTEGPKAPLRVLAQGRYLTVVDEGGWEYVTRHRVTGIVVIVAVTPEGKLLLVEQYRMPVHMQVIELPAGLVGDEDGRGAESLADAAGRELIEETGYAASELATLAAGPIAVGVSDEVVTFFLAKSLERVGPGGGVDNEQITVHEVAPRDLAAFLAERRQAGLAVDPKIFAGLYLAGPALER
jgi:ADP-ribose pyrophosphatase